MLFGYALAAIAGFLMTAVPNWTGTAPMQGWPLVGLASLWLVGRIAVWAGPALPLWAVAAADLPLIPALAVVMGRLLWRTRNPRNFVFVGVLTLLFVGNLHTYVHILGPDRNRGLLVALDAVTLLIVIVGGRITPSFTAAMLRMREDEAQVVRFEWLDRVAILSVVALALVDLLPVSDPVRGAIALFAGAANTARLAGYRTGRVLDRPILWVLHVGYGWAALGLLLKGAAVFIPALPPTAALHALTVGAIGSMTLGVMSRASLGHTGRDIAAPVPIVAAYGLVSLAAVLRVFTILVAPAWYLDSILVSGALWVLAFSLFVVVYAPILTRPRPDGRPG
jgi:uncharacterized protein involved in response to NO